MRHTLILDTSDDAEDDRSMLDHGLAWSDIAPESRYATLEDAREAARNLAREVRK